MTQQTLIPARVAARLAVAVAVVFALPGCGEIKVADPTPFVVADSGADAGDEDVAGDAVVADAGDAVVADADADAAGDADAAVGDGGTGDGGVADVDASADAIDDSGGDVGSDAVDDGGGDVGADGISDDGGDAGADGISDGDASGDATSDTGPGPCKANADCSGGKPYCDLAKGSCVACVYHGHCSGPFGRCHQSACLSPRPCASDAVCASEQGVCGAHSFCADCITDANCAAGQSCVLFQCLPKPKDCATTADCAASGKLCGGAGACVDCEDSGQCAKGEVCAAGLCTPPLCKSGDTICVGPTTPGTCVADGAGWTPAPCQEGQGCDVGQCKSWVCVPGSKACAGDFPTHCPPDGLAWELGAQCKANETCVDGVCTNEVCQPGQTQCTSGGELQTCNATKTGWDKSACPTGQACSGGACLNIVCTPTESFCIGETLWACNGVGTSKTFINDCSAGGGFCAEGDCLGVPCAKGTKLCKGESVMACADDGSKWVEEKCSGTGADLCVVSACDPATKACKSGAQKSCDDGNACTEGKCAPATGDCEQSNVVGTCDDGDACTSGDNCKDGACVFGGAQVITFAGAKIPGFVDGAAADARFGLPVAAARSEAGVVYVADRNNHRIRSVNAKGDVSTLAGVGVAGFADGPAATAMMAYPMGVATRQGWVAFSDRSNHRVRRVTPAGMVVTLAGDGVAGDNDGKGAVARFYAPEAIAMNAKGEIFVVEPNRHRIRRVSPDGTVLTIAGSASAGFADGDGTAAKFQSPGGIAVDADGTIYVVDRGNRRLRAISAAFKVSTLAGTGAQGSEDGAADKATFVSPYDVAIFAPDALDGGVAGAPNLVISDGSAALLRRYRGGAAPTVDTIAGVVNKHGVVDGPADKAEFNNAMGLWAEPDGVGVCDAGGYVLRRLRRAKVGCDDGDSCTVDACDAKTGACTAKFAKAGVACDDGDACTSGDACAAEGGCLGKTTPCDDKNACTADYCDPWLGSCVAVPSDDVCDDGDPCTLADHCEAGVCAGGGGWIGTVAGNGSAGSDDGVGTAATFVTPARIATINGAPGSFKPGSVVFVSDRDGHRIRRVWTATWQVEALAGSGAGFADGALDAAKFQQPFGLDMGSDAVLYVADTGNHRVRAVTIDAGAGPAKGKVATFAGDGQAGHVDGPAAAARFSTPEDVAVGGGGALYVADSANRVIRRVKGGVVETVIGSGAKGSLDGAAEVARFEWPTRIVFSDDLLYIVDRDGHRVRRWDGKAGAVSTWLGNGVTQWVDGVGTAASLVTPMDLAVGPGGRWWLSSTQNVIAEIRAGKAGAGGVAASPRLTRRVGFNGGGLLDGPLQSARVNQPRGLALVGGTLLVADANNRRLRLLEAGEPACVDDDTPCAPTEGCDKASGACKAASPKDGDACSADACTLGVCKAGACQDTAPPKCDDGKPCTLDACDAKAGGCTYAQNGADATCCAPKPWDESFEGDAKLDADPANGGVSWQALAPPTTIAPTDGKMALKFGAQGNVALDGSGAGYYAGEVRLGKVVLPKATALSIEADAYFDVAPATTATRLYVRVSSGMITSNLSVLYANKAGWQKLKVDVSGLAGETVEIKLRGQIHPSAKGSGIWVDHVRVSADCKPKACTSAGQCNQPGFGCIKSSCTEGVCGWQNECCLDNADCDDGKPCTTDFCSGGYCNHQPIAGCCEKAEDCKDADVCVAATCPVAGGSCAWDAVAGCCNVDGDCDDGKPCTTDVCGDKHTCSHQDICCKTTAECDDKNACTTDACTEGFCSWTYKTTAGCCIPTQGAVGFEKGVELGGWTRETCQAGGGLPTNCVGAPWAAPTKGWQLWAGSGNAHSGSGVLYYGDPAAKNFAFGASAEIARSPAYVVQPGVSKFVLWLWWDTEAPTNYDRIQIYPVVEGKRELTANAGSPSYGAAWYKAQPGATAVKTWTKVEIDVSAFVGKKVAAEIYFNTVDSVGNNGLGVFVDDFSLVSSCGK